MAAAPGEVVSIYYDAYPGQFVTVGDALRTRTGRTYCVVHARQQTRGKHAGRYHLRCAVVDGPNTPVGVTVHPLVWYKRS